MIIKKVDDNANLTNVDGIPLAVIQSIMAIGTNNPQRNSTFVASECQMTFCVQSYGASVGQDQSNQTGPNANPYQEKLLESWTVAGVDPSAVSDGVDPDDVLNVYLTPPVNPSKGVYAGQRFGIPRIALSSLNIYISSLLPGVAYQISDNFGFSSSDSVSPDSISTTSNGNIDALQAIYTGNFPNCATPDNKVACAIENIAKAMSKSFRDAPLVTRGVDAANMGKGKTYISVTFVEVTWYWIALPVFVWMLSLVTFIGTAWKSRRAGVKTWRTNPLAMVFLRIPREEHEKVKDLGMSESALAEKAEKLTVRLHVTEDEARLGSG
jgi:hypothetical protein